jgi:hypothetical protein
LALKPLKRAYKDLPTVPLNLRDGVVTEKPEKGIKDTDPLIEKGIKDTDPLIRFVFQYPR